MSIDRSLRTRGSLERHRNVLTRAERVAQLQDQDKWDDSQSPLALPKLAHRKAKTGGKKSKTEAAAEGQEKK